MLIISVIMASCINNSQSTSSPLEGYEWLKGHWEAQQGYNWGRVEITDSTYKYVCSNSCNSPDEIKLAPEYLIAIATVNSYITGSDILSIDSTECNIGIDAVDQRIFIILGEYDILYLNKIDNNSHETKIRTQQELREELKLKPYGLKDDNLKGRVKRMEEHLLKTNDDYYKCYIVKQYDSLGRISFYYSEGDNTLFDTKTSVFQRGFPLLDDNIYIRKTIRNKLYLNPIHLLGYNAASNKVNFNPPYTFEYNDENLVSKIYEKGDLIYLCEYDDYGRLTTRYEHNLPTMQIHWFNNDPKNLSHKIVFYSEDGYERETLNCKMFDDDNTILTSESGTDVHYTLDDNNKIVEKLGFGVKVKIAYDNNKIAQISVSDGTTFIYKYNDSNDMIEYVKTFGPSTTIWKWKYEYDDIGNWTKATKFEVIKGDIEIEQEIESIIRKIEYYE